MLLKCILFICFISLTNQIHLRSKYGVTDGVSVTNDTSNWKQNTTYATSTISNVGVDKKVNVKLLYETLCPASVSFFTRQLKPAVEKLALFVDVELVPYGFARTLKIKNEYRFRCQHGPDECYRNMLHACAIDAIQNSTQAVLFNACLMEYSRYMTNNNFDNIVVLNWCGYKLNVLINGVWECMNSGRGSILLKNYGEETQALRPRYVPYLVLDGSMQYENAGLRDLQSTICRMLHPSPPSCYSA